MRSRAPRGSGTAKAPLPRKTARARGSVTPAASPAPRPRRRRPAWSWADRDEIVHRVEVVDVQLAVEVVELVLERAGQEAAAGDLDLPAEAVLGHDPDLLAARHVGDVAGDRQAALEVAVVAVERTMRGLMSSWSWPSTSMTQAWSATPTCGAAGPTPGASRIVSVRSSSSRGGTCRSCRRARP